MVERHGNINFGKARAQDDLREPLHNLGSTTLCERDTGCSGRPHGTALGHWIKVLS
jgi:hypothetical protein